MDATSLTMLLDGIDVSRVRRPELWRPRRSPTSFEVDSPPRD
jgi:hypothetical protein